MFGVGCHNTSTVYKYGDPRFTPATVKQLTESMDKNMKALRTEVAELKTTVSAVETRMDTKIDSLRSLINSEIKTVRDDIKTEVKTKVDEGITGLNEEVVTLRKRLVKAEGEIERLTELVGNAPVQLELEMENRDPYNRLLTHVWHNNDLVSEELLKEGYVMANTKYPNKYSQELFYAQEYARILGYGIWDNE